jgi:iron-sulfur cluster assembly protein
MKKNITKDMTIEEIFQKFPQKSQKLAQELTNIGLSCVGCSAASYETIESGLLSHGMDEEQLNKLLSRLNRVLEETTDATKVSLTKKAAEKFLQICKVEKKIGYGLRLKEIPAGCSGFEYVLEFAKKPLEEDLVFTFYGVDIFIDENQKERLLGCEIDYLDGLQSGGFKISNPNAKSSCSCGSSHGY